MLYNSPKGKEKKGIIVCSSYLSLCQRILRHDSPTRIQTKGWLNVLQLSGTLWHLKDLKAIT